MGMIANTANTIAIVETDLDAMVWWQKIATKMMKKIHTDTKAISHDPNAVHMFW